jgi:hypothetical protein
MTTTEQAAAAARSDVKRAAARERPIMTAAELREHQTASYGRDYRESDDGYSDMEAEEKRGWRALAGWGRDGWDLGDWPYVVMYTRRSGDKFELMQIVEGDRTAYEFATADDRRAALDYLFLWYAAGESWAPLTYEDRARLDAGELTVDPKRTLPSWTR